MPQREVTADTTCTMKYHRLIIIALLLSAFCPPLAAHKRGESIIKDEYSIIPSEGGTVIGFVRLSDGKIGFVKNTSSYNVYIEPTYDDMYNEDFSVSKRVLVERNGKWGALGTIRGEDAYIKETVPCIYDRLTQFKNGRSRATLNGKSFWIDLYGKRIA